jgi:NhaP-type Na+/H+ or K+/H+ antiporter
MAALGMMNILFSVAPPVSLAAGYLLLAGTVAMPAVCFLSAWKMPFRQLFFIPVSLLCLAVILTLTSGQK